MATFAEESSMDMSEEMVDGNAPSFPPVSAVDANVSSPSSHEFETLFLTSFIWSNYFRVELLSTEEFGALPTD